MRLLSIKVCCFGESAGDNIDKWDYLCYIETAMKVIMR